MAGNCRSPKWFWLRVYRLGLALQRWSGVGTVTMSLKVDTSKYNAAMREAGEALRRVGEAFTMRGSR